MSAERVRPQVYDQGWVAAAWGERGNEALLAPGPIEPRPRIARALELAALGPGVRLLDIACGRGEVPAIAAAEGAIAVGLDYAEASIEFARRVRDVHATQACGRMDLVCGDATRLPFADASFDRVTMLDIIEHLHPGELEAMLGEVRRVLAPGGFAVLHTLPNRWVYDVTYRVLHRLWPRVPADPRNEYEKRIHVNEQDLPRLHRLLARVGLAHRIWLEQHIPAQARWSAVQRDRFGDPRDPVYARLAGPAGRALEWLCRIGPARLLLCNDIFGVAWNGPPPPGLPPLPWALTERLAARLCSRS